ncbi:MAG: T9SS C-terminal target domain-containing protein [Porphyromonadaceae bacterium]|nr:MAG: T9SS C-terminal target domain-containing protein [Porphyromonadaceae bacterium]
MKQITINQAVKLFFLTLAGFSVFTFHSNAQIVFEQSYPYSGTITQLEKEGPKFYLMDVTAKECRIYNLDYSLFRTIKLDVPSNRYLYDIQFVTQHLFDSDDGVELLYVFYQYVQTATSYYYIYTTRIADENGSVLLDLPGCSWTEIKNISGSGSRMLNYVKDYSVYPYPVETRIYRLPGQITGVDTEAIPDFSGDPVFPNPTSGLIRMHPDGFSTNDKAEWVILDSTGKLIARVPVLDPGNPVDLKSLGLVAGIYLVRMESRNYQTKFQQVVLHN